MEILDTATLHFDQDSLLLMNACLGLVMFGVALELTLADFRRLLWQPRPVAVGLIAQIIALPAITYLLTLVLPLSTSVALGMLLVAVCPGGNLSNLLTVMARGDGALSVSLTALSTLLAIFMVPVSFSFWSHLYLQSQAEEQTLSLPATQMITTLLGVVGLPLLLGMLANRYFPGIVSRVRRPIRILSLVVLIAFIVGALAGNFSLFMRFIHLLLLLVLLHNAVAYGVGWALSSVFRLDMASRKAITIETGIQNSGLALVIIFNFYDGWGGMAFLAGWWGVWDMVSGSLLAWGLSRWRSPAARVLNG